MKLFICLCVLVTVLDPCVRAKSFHFADFFFGNSNKDADGDPILARQISGSISERLEDSSEFDSYLFNASADEEFPGFEFRNSTSDNYENSTHDEAERIPTIPNEEASTEPKNNESQTAHNNSETTASVSSTVTDGNTAPEGASTAVNASELPTSTVTDEKEEVVLGSTTETAAVPIPKTILQKSIDWVEDAYTLSILIPIAAGVLFATTIIITIALCRYLRRCCRRRRFKRKALPDSVKNLRPSDRAKLLGESSDEEF